MQYYYISVDKDTKEKETHLHLNRLHIIEKIDFATSRAHNTIKVSASLCAGNIKLSGKSEMLETLILL